MAASKEEEEEEKRSREKTLLFLFKIKVPLESKKKIGEHLKRVFLVFCTNVPAV